LDGERKTDRAWLRLAGLGFELAASIAGGALFGWWIDRRLDSAPKALITMTVVGLVGGFYNLIRVALAAARKAEKSAPEEPGSGGEAR
jgi:F0F1-type ATP synthase assembly protein I